MMVPESIRPLQCNGSCRPGRREGRWVSWRTIRGFAGADVVGLVWTEFRGVLDWIRGRTTGHQPFLLNSHHINLSNTP